MSPMITKLVCSLFLFAGTACVSAQTVSKVYMYKEITPENLVKIYEALGREINGKVAVKLSTGEPGGHNFLQPALIKDLVQEVNGTIVECNTAAHLQAAEDHGKIHLIERIDSRQGMHTLDYAEQIGLGSQQYELVRLD